MKKAIKKLSIWVLMVAMIATIMPATTGWAQTRHSSITSPYEAFTPSAEKRMENAYWEVIFSLMHVDPQYYKWDDGFIVKDEVRIVAWIILDKMLGYPGGEPGDDRARDWQRHWGNFFWRIASGQFSNRELQYHLRRTRRRAQRYGIPLW